MMIYVDNDRFRDCIIKEAINTIKSGDKFKASYGTYYTILDVKNGFVVMLESHNELYSPQDVETNCCVNLVIMAQYSIEDYFRNKNLDLFNGSDYYNSHEWWIQQVLMSNNISYRIAPHHDQGYLIAPQFKNYGLAVRLDYHNDARINVIKEFAQNAGIDICFINMNEYLVNDMADNLILKLGVPGLMDLVKEETVLEKGIRSYISKLLCINDNDYNYNYV